MAAIQHRIMLFSVYSLIATIPLGGCGIVRPLAPPDVPTITSITARMAEVSRVFDGSISPPAYVSAGYLYVDERCAAFFSQLANARREFELSRKEALLSITTATTVL